MRPRVRNDFSSRLDRAVMALLRGRTSHRGYDDCFEQGDGDAVVLGIVRRARRNQQLMAAVLRHWNGVVPDRWLTLEAQHRRRNPSELSRELLFRFAVQNGYPCLWRSEGPAGPVFFNTEAEAMRHHGEVQRGGHRTPPPSGLKMPQCAEDLMDLLREINRAA